MKFTTRDLLWLMVVGAVMSAWFASDRHRANQAQHREQYWKDRLAVSEEEQAIYRDYWDGADEALQKAGVEWPLKGK